MLLQLCLGSDLHNSYTKVRVPNMPADNGWYGCRVRDKDMSDLGIRLEDRPDGSWIVKEMSAAEQQEVICFA